MYFEEYGSRENHTVILLHGAGGVYSFVQQYGFSDRLHLVVPHQLGCGEECDKEYSLKGCIEGILEIICSFRKNTVSVAGFSLGAQMVIPLLCAAQELFDKAIMVSPWILKDPKTLRFVHVLQQLFFPLEKWAIFVKRQAQAMGMNEEQIRTCLRQSAGLTRANVTRYVFDGVDIKNYPEFKNLGIPMLAMCGERESEKLMIRSVTTLAALNENCKCRVLKDHAHDIPFKNPEQFNTIFEEFFVKRI